MGSPATIAESEHTTLREPPGPRYLEPFRPTRQLLADPLGMLHQVFREHGDVAQIRIGPLRYYSVAHPDHLKHVLQENNQNYTKGPILARTKVLIGEGLFSSEGELWRRQRRLAQPAFHRPRIGSFAATMVECCRDMLDEWAVAARRGDVFDLMAEMSRVALRIAGRTLFSLDLARDASAVGDAMVSALEETQHRVFNLFIWPLLVPTRRNRRFVAARRVLDEVVLRIIATRRQQDDAGSDLLGLMLAARDEATGEGMSDRQLRDEVITFVLAGHETTAVTLAWTWYLLGRHPEIEQRLREEVDRAIGAREPSAEDLPGLRYVRMVVEESLRLYPPLWAFARQAIADDQLGPFRIRAGAPVNLSPWLAHRHPEFWTDPERFDPERFSPERVAARHRFAYLPFSAGPRLCIGNEFALMEATLLVAMMAQRYRIELSDPARPIEPDVKLTLRPRGGVPVRLAM